MTKFLLLILITILLNSCGTGMRIRNSRVSYFDSSFAASIEVNSFKTIGSKRGISSLMHLFEIREEKVDSVFIRFNDKKELQFTYLHNGEKREKLFTGRFAKRGFYEIYFRNQKKELPPIFPIIYSVYHIKRVRLALTIEGDLIVDDMWDESGTIFIVGAGSSGRRQSFFRTRGINAAD